MGLDENNRLMSTVASILAWLDYNFGFFNDNQIFGKATFFLDTL